MSTTTISSTNRQAWQNLANATKDNNPFNKRCKVIKGRKFKNCEGIVIRLMEDKYYDWKYTSEASRLLKQFNGREGYVALMQQDNGETFWVKSVYLEII